MSVIIFKYMKRNIIYYIFAIFFFITFFNLHNNFSYASDEDCRAAGGDCRNIYTDCRSTDGWQPIMPTIHCNSPTSEMCCERVDDKCRSLGYDCWRSNVDPSKYVEVAYSCPEDEQQCYKPKLSLECDPPSFCHPFSDCADIDSSGAGACGTVSNKMLVCCKREKSDDDSYSDDNYYSSDDPNYSKELSDPRYRGPYFETLQDVIVPVARLLYYAALVIGLGAIIFAGYSLMVSEGNPDRVKEAQSQLTAAVLGIIFILLSAAILRIIIRIFLGYSFGV